MPFQVNSLTKEVSTFCNKSVNKPAHYGIYELSQTDAVAKPNCEFVYSKADGGFKYIENGLKAMTVFTVQAANEVADSIARSSYYGDYRDVKKDLEWLKLYDHSQHAMTGKFGGQWETLNLDVIPCYYCGLGLPLNLIEVDHWFEKKKRATGAVQAILKVFRASGHSLTMGGPTGDKGSQFGKVLQGKVATIGTRGTLKNNGLTWHYRLNELREDFVDLKRQLSVSGLIMLSILYHATENSITTLDSFYQMFINHFINLVPACPNCNKLKNQR